MERTSTSINPDAGSDLFRMVVPALVGWLYFIVLNGRGQTAGKALLGLRVVDEAGNAPGLKRGAVRFIIPAVVWILMASIPLVETFGDEDRPVGDPVLLIVGGASPSWASS